MKKIGSLFFKLIGIVCIIIVCIFGLALCDISNDDVVENTSTEQQETAFESSEDTSPELLISALENLAAESFIDNEFKVYAEGTTVYLDVWFPGLADDLTNSIIANDLTAWKTLVNAINSAAENGYELAQQMAPGYSVIYTYYDVVNGKDCPFVSSYNGTTMFDMAEETLGNY